MPGGGAGQRGLLRAPVRGAGRLIRIGIFSAMPLLLASGAHISGGGSLPAGGVALSAVVLLLISTCVSVRRCRFALLVGLLAVEQVLIHMLFTAAESAVKCMPAGSASSVHAGHGGPDGLSAAGGAVQACAEGHPINLGWSMIIAHAVSTVLVSWLLARGESWWWRSVAALVRAVFAKPTRRRPRPATITVAGRRIACRVTFAPAAPRGPPLPS